MGSCYVHQGLPARIYRIYLYAVQQGDTACTDQKDDRFAHKEIHLCKDHGCFISGKQGLFGIYNRKDHRFDNHWSALLYRSYADEHAVQHHDRCYRWCYEYHSVLRSYHRSCAVNTADADS